MPDPIRSLASPIMIDIRQRNFPFEDPISRQMTRNRAEIGTANQFSHPSIGINATRVIISEIIPKSVPMRFCLSMYAK